MKRFLLFLLMKSSYIRKLINIRMCSQCCFFLLSWGYNINLKLFSMNGLEQKSFYSCTRSYCFFIVTNSFEPRLNTVYRIYRGWVRTMLTLSILISLLNKRKMQELHTAAHILFNRFKLLNIIYLMHFRLR